MEPQDLDAQIAQELTDRGYEATPEAIEKIKSKLGVSTPRSRTVQRFAAPSQPEPVVETPPAAPTEPPEEGFGEKLGDAVDALQGGFAQITASGFRAADTAARKLGSTFAGVPYEQVRRGVGGYGGAFADAAEYFREVEESNRLSDADQSDYVNQIARGIGNAAGFSVASIAGGPGIGGLASIGAYGAATQSNDAYWRILDKTKDEEKAWQGASLNAIAGGSEAFGAFIPGARALGSILFRMDKSTGGAIKKALLPSMAGGMLKGGLAEAGQEMFQGSAEVAIDRYLDVYPEDRRTIMQVAKDVYETQGAPAFGVGAVLAPLGIAAERADMRARERARSVERVERPEGTEREMAPESAKFFEQLKSRGARRVVETPEEFKPQEEAARRRGLRLYAIETSDGSTIAGVERSGTGDIFININRRNEAIRGTIDHEVDHKLEVMDPDGYAAKAKIIEETEPELLQQKMLEVKERYAQEGVELSDDNAKREAIALLMETEVFPFTEAFRTDPKLVEEFLTDDRGSFKKVLEATMDVMNEMGAGFDTRRARLGKLLERVNAIEGKIKPESAARIAQEYVRSMQTLETLETGRAEAEQAAQRKAAEDRARARAEARAAATAGREAAPTAAPTAPVAAEAPAAPGAPKALPAAPAPTPTDLISSDEAASLLGLSPSELVGLRDDGVLRSRGTDAEGRMVFSKAEVEAAMSAIGTEAPTGVPTESVATTAPETLEPSPVTTTEPTVVTTTEPTVAEPTVAEPTVAEPTVAEPTTSAVADDVIAQRLETLVDERKRRYESAKADLDAIGPRPPKPSSEKKRFGSQGRKGASAEDVQRYDAEVKAYQSWNRKYLRLKKAEVDASNEFFSAQQALESRKRIVAKAANERAAKPKLQLVTTPKPSVEISEVNPRAPLQPNVAYFRVINERGQLTATLGAEYDGTPQDLMLVMDKLDEEVNRSFEWKSEFYNMASQRLATDASGKLKWVVSPSLQNLSEISTESAAWTLGIRQSEPSQTQKETNAPQVRPQQQGGVVERPQAPQGGLPAEASGGNRPVEGQAPEERYSFTDAGIRQSAQDGVRFSFTPWREMSDWLDGTGWWPSGLEDFRNKYVDYLATTKRLVAQAARKPAEMVPAMSRTLRRRGLAKTRIEQISDPLVRKFEARAKELGVKIDDVADFMRARVAPLANARVDTVERRDPDNYYSGVTDAEALAIITRLKADPAYYKKLVEVVKIVDEMNELRLDIDVRSGRLKAEDAKAMRDTYSPAALAAMDPTYKNEEGFKTLYGSLQSVPEKSVIDEGLVDTPGVGRGLGKSGAPAKARTGTKKGSKRELANPIVNAMMALQAAVVREVKAEEQRSWRDFVAGVGDPKFGVVMDKVPTKRVLGSDGYVHVIPDPNWSARPGVLPFLEQGEWKAIVFKEDNRLIAEDLKALTVSAPIEGVAQITRGMSQLLTRYDPTFFLRNVPRDFGWAMMAGGVRYGYKFSRQMSANWPSATREIFRNKFRGAPATGYYKEYLESGAETSMIPFRDYNQSLRDLRKAVEKRDGTKFFQAYEKYVGGANDVFEAATRYAVFKTARLQGKTVEEAAVMAKEGAGLNFEQTGRYGRRINSLYAFFNAGINGTDQLLRLINPKNPDKETRIRAAQAVAAVVGVGIVQEILNRSFSDDGEDGEKEYDNISNFEKNRNMVFMLPEGGYLKAPLPFGFNAIYALGRNIAAYSMGAVSAAEASTDAVTFFMESGSPLGSGPVTQVITPTMFEPIVQVATNQSFTGAKIAPDTETFGRSLVAPHDLYWKNTPEAPKEIARILAEATEKGDSGRGYIDIRPDIIEHIFAAYVGGAGQRAIEATDNLSSLVKGNVPEARQTFGLRHFVGQASPYAIDKRYSDNREAIENVKARYEELVKEGDKETAQSWLKANEPLVKAYNALRGTERMLDRIPNTPENEERRRSVKARFTATLSQLKGSPK